MRIKIIILSLMLYIPTSVYAEWFNNDEINWWLVVFQRQSCEMARDLGADLTPTNLINHKKCEYIYEDSIEDELAILSCKEVDVIFTTEKNVCEEYLSRLIEVMEAQ